MRNSIAFTSAALRSSIPSVRNTTRSPACNTNSWTGYPAPTLSRTASQGLGLRSLPAVTHQYRQGMPGVHDPCGTVDIVHPDDLSGHEVVVIREFVEHSSASGSAPQDRCRGGERFAVPRPALLPARPRSAYGPSRRHREVERVSFDAEVERVATDVARWLQPSGQRELVPLAGVRGWKESVLDLRLQRERLRALSPLKQVCESAVRDHDVRKGVCPCRDCCQRL